jgi:hypothetical protein
MMPALRAVLHILVPISGARLAVWRRLPSGAIKGRVLLISAGLSWRPRRGTTLALLWGAIVLTIPMAGEALPLGAAMVEPIMLGAFAVKAVVAEAMMMRTLAAKDMMAVAAMAIGTLFAEAAMAESMMPRFLTIKVTVMAEAMVGEAAFIAAPMVIAVFGKTLIVGFRVAGAFLLAALRSGGMMISSML